MGAEAETIGPYRVERRLGEGGMGEVFLAWDQRLARPVAIQRIRPEASDRHGMRERFRREARLAAGLDHPAIVRIYDLLEAEAGDALVMEYVEGTRLSQRIRPGAPPLPEALRLGRGVTAPRRAAPRRGVRRGPRRRPHPRGGAPRPQGRERDGHRRRPRQGARLRP